MTVFVVLYHKFLGSAGFETSLLKVFKTENEALDYKRGLDYPVVDGVEIIAMEVE